MSLTSYLNAMGMSAPFASCRVIEALMEAAKDMGCYKVILDCSNDNVPFYSKCGLEKKEIQMVG
jgi:hypothetical protein